MKEPIALTPVFEGWAQYQQHLTTAIAPLTPEQLTLQIAPHLRSIMMLAAHIVATRVWWFHFALQEGPDDLRPLVKWDIDGEPERTADELVEGLNRTWAMMQDGLTRWTQADLEAEFQRPEAKSSKTVTRQWIIWHVLEHDLHHGGELSFALGVHGLPAIDL